MYQKPTDEELKEIWAFNLTNHKPTPEAIEKIEKVREAAKAYVGTIIDCVPESRERSLALTGVENANFHAISGIARNENEDKD